MPAIPSKNTRCRFGVAVRDVTPPVEIYARWWGASLRDQANGVHRPFSATAAVFAPIDGDGAQLVLVALDQCSFQNPDDERALRAAIRERAGLGEEQVLLNLSHSHSSANTNSLLGNSKPGGEVVPVYLARLAQDLGDAVVEAQRSLAPVWITHGSGRCAMAANRDFWDEESGRFVCGFNPNLPADDTVMVARVVDDGGTTLATLFNYACHPTTLAWDNDKLSPDFIGAAREVLERAFGAPAIFLQGALGDLGPRDGFVGDPAVADRNGRQLGYATASAIEGLPPAATQFVYTGAVRSGTEIGTWAHQPLDEEARQAATTLKAIRLDVALAIRPFPSSEALRAQLEACEDRVEEERIRRRLMLRRELGEGETHTMPLWFWRLGDAVLVAIPEEPYSAIQPVLRQTFAETPVWVLGVTNGDLGYLPPREAYGTGVYQEVQSPFQPGCFETTIETAKRGIAAVLA